MPSRKNFDILKAQVEARPGAAARLERLRQETLAEIALYEFGERWTSPKGTRGEKTAN